MAKKSRVYERVEDHSGTYERIGAAELEEALGAESFASHTGGGSPFTVWALRSRLMSDLVSTGGRPARRDASARKISMTDGEWDALEEVTRLLKGQGVSATPGQLAGLLLHQSLAEVLRRLDRVSPSKPVEPTASHELTNARLEETLEGVLAAAASAEVHLEQLRPVALELLRRMRDDKERSK